MNKKQRHLNRLKKYKAKKNMAIHRTFISVGNKKVSTEIFPAIEFEEIKDTDADKPTVEITLGWCNDNNVE